MDNKKTFADLFSSSTATNEQEETNFDENLHNQVKEQTSSQDQKITFDNLFDQTIEENKEQGEIFKRNKEINLNSILSSNDKTSSDEEENQPQEDFNLFFKKELESQKTDSETNTSLENPFFEKEKTTEETQPQEALNIFFQKEPELPKTDSETNTSLENPFFEKEKTVEENQPQEALNIFFQKEPELPKTDSETNTSLENPFFEKEKMTEENLIKESNDPLSEINNSKKEQENETKETISTSPFFEKNEEVKEENPLFLNKISLIENETHEQKIGTIDSKKSKHFNVKIVKKKEPLFKFILGVISYAIFIWLLLIGITLLVYVLDIKIRAAKGDYSSPTFNAYVVLTGSMLPEIQVYDVVVTKKVDASNLKEGDIITFASADSRFLNTIITHRIIKKNYDAESKSYTFQTKGDNNNVADSALVPQNNIYGKVILKIPKLGYLQEFLASDGGWIIVILIPCLTVISYDIVKLAKGLKRRKYKNIKVQK